MSKDYNTHCPSLLGEVQFRPTHSTASLDETVWHWLTRLSEKYNTVIYFVTCTLPAWVQHGQGSLWLSSALCSTEVPFLSCTSGLPSFLQDINITHSRGQHQWLTSVPASHQHHTVGGSTRGWHQFLQVIKNITHTHTHCDTHTHTHTHTRGQVPPWNVPFFPCLYGPSPTLKCILPLSLWAKSHPKMYLSFFPCLYGPTPTLKYILPLSLLAKSHPETYHSNEHACNIQQHVHVSPSIICLWSSVWYWSSSVSSLNPRLLAVKLVKWLGITELIKSMVDVGTLVSMLILICPLFRLVKLYDDSGRRQNLWISLRLAARNI